MENINPLTKKAVYSDNILSVYTLKDDARFSGRERVMAGPGPSLIKYSSRTPKIFKKIYM